MTKENIIRMAREAGWKDLRDYDSAMHNEFFMGSTNDLIAFAALVAAAEREAIIQEIPGGFGVDPQWVCDMILARSNT